MLTSTPIGRLTKRFGTKEAIRIVAKAGFDAYDMTLCSVEKIEGHPLTGPDFRAAAQEIRAYADSLGLVCNQTHAVYPTSRGDERDPEIFETAVRHLEISAILGAKGLHRSPQSAPSVLAEYRHAQADQYGLLPPSRPVLREIRHPRCA